MGNRNILNEIKNGVKMSVPVAFVLGIIAALTFVFIRTHPKWKPAELTIESAHRFFEIEDLNPEGMTLETRINTPEGYTRVPAEEGSFQEYLRKYPLLPDNINLPAFNGTTINSPYVSAVFDISLGDDGYQECADSVIRLYSDYFYETKQYDKISFQFSNGDVCDYNRWRKGKRMFVLRDFSCELPAAFPSDSEQQYRNYLKEVMRYAGTLSLLDESKEITADEIRTGDIICNSSHVVLIVDEAENEKGEKCYLIGQSFIPSVCFHIINRSEGNVTTSWYTQADLEKESLTIGQFGFANSDIRRWKEGF